MAHNVQLPDGEIDLLANDGDGLVVVEVKTIATSDADPLSRIDDAKRRRLWRLAFAVGARRVEHVGIRLGLRGIEITRLPG